jgi:hypothetical protein
MQNKRRPGTMKKETGTRKPGRLLTTTSKKVGIDIYAPLDRLAIIDAMVAEEKEGGNNKASRSELYNKAMDEYLTRLGKLKP